MLVKTIEYKNNPIYLSKTVSAQVMVQRVTLKQKILSTRRERDKPGVEPRPPAVTLTH